MRKCDHCGIETPGLEYEEVILLPFSMRDLACPPGDSIPIRKVAMHFHTMGFRAFDHDKILHLCEDCQIGMTAYLMSAADRFLGRKKK